MADPLLLSAATFGFTVACTAIATTWSMSRMMAKRDANLIAMMSAHELADAQRFAAVRTEIGDLGESVRHEFGETSAALRQKMHDMEMWGRDYNLSKRTFEIVTGEIKEVIKTLVVKVDNVIMRNGRVDQGRSST